MVDKDALGPVLRLVILAAGTTGLRQSELLGLRWRDVDMRAQRVRVRNAWVRYEHSGEGKSDLSTKRSVPMTDRLAGELKKWRLRTVFGDERTWSSPIPSSACRSTARRSRAIPGGVRGGWRPPDPLPRPAPHVRDHARRRRRAAADDPGVPRPRGSEDDADLRPLRAVRARGRRSSTRRSAALPRTSARLAAGVAPRSRYELPRAAEALQVRRGFHTLRLVARLLTHPGLQ